MTMVLLVGDSLAVGLTYRMRQIAGSRGLGFVADATVGTTAREWVSSGRFASDVQAYRPDIVLVSLGTNDAHGDDSNFRNDVAAIVGTGGASVRWIAPPPMPFDTSRVLAAIEASGVPVFHSGNAYPRAADGIHMPPSGYAAWADDIAAAGFLDAGAPISSLKKWIVVGAAALGVAYLAGWL